MTDIDNEPSLIEAVDRVLAIFSNAQDSNTPFPPAEMFSEGWMLRLLLDAHKNGRGGLPIPLIDGTTWYSEARLNSAFQPSRRGDPHGEGQTHADGVIGQFDFRPDTTAGLTLRPDSTQFVVIEAKMGSKLAPGTSRVGWFDQAVRNIAAMAWTLWQQRIDPDTLESLVFAVIAPQDRIDIERTFTRYTSRDSVTSKVARRIDLYQEDDSRRHAELVEFHDTLFEPFLASLDLQLISWEDTIASTRGDTRAALDAFYAVCRTHNGLSTT